MVQPSSPLSAIPYRAPNNASSNLIFSYRSRHAAIVLGDFLYIQGGEFGLWDGVGSPLNFNDYVNNYTLTLDLSTSWTIEDTVLSGSLSTAPPYNSGTLWLDATASSFYAYDGSASFAPGYSNVSDPSPANAFWKFTPSGSEGSWEKVAPSASSNFSHLVRVNNAAYAYGNGLGFAVAGNAGYNGLIPSPGLVLFNSSSLDQPWSNISTTTYNSSGFAIGGAAHFVPDFGPEGLLFVIGGALDNDGDLDSTDSISIFDVESQEWTRQQITGDRPPPPQNPCLVGMKGDNNTYEIFLFGGRAQNRSSSPELNSVFVLSLPSFVWQKETSNRDTGRFLHTCNVVGSRQMLVMGGLVTNATVYQMVPDLGNDIRSPSIPDPWPQGIGIFDLSDFAWKDNYDASALPYVTPNIVKDEIKANGSYPKQWANQQVEDWFASRTSTKSTTTLISGTPFEPTGSSTRSSSTSSMSSSNHTGAITGGVVGGVVGLALLAIAVFSLFRHYRRRRGTKTNIYGNSIITADTMQTKQPRPIGWKHKLHGQALTAEMDAQHTARGLLPEVDAHSTAAPVNNLRRSELPSGSTG